MDKKEFLDILEQTLKGEVNEDAIRQNVSYYDQYISSQSLEEEAQVIDKLGDPRLIAKTIIETEKAAHKNNYKDGYNNSGTGRYTDSGEEGKQDNMNSGHKIFHTNLTWFQKLTLIIVLIAFIFLLILIGRILIGFLFAFAVPILLILLLYALFKKRN